MILRHTLLLLGFVFVLNVNAQVIDMGKPQSWSMTTKSKKNISPNIMESFDIEKIKAEDKINDDDRTIPFRFGYEIDIDLGIENDGAWDEFSNGDRVWRINIVSKGAKTLNFIFDTFQIPSGAYVYLYNDNKTDVLGAYTSSFNRPDSVLGTWLVEGESVWIEYFEPASVKGEGRLNIAKVIHGYRSVTDLAVKQKALGSSADCNYDVDCSIGADFDAVKNELKRSVALFLVGGGLCTGTLINNTSNNRAPYFLSANHCFVDRFDNQLSDPATWAFRFNWVSPNPSCGTTDFSTDGDRSQQTTSGATVLARNKKTDMLLLNIDTGFPADWNLKWAGWDRSGSMPNFVVGIHHPEGDIMKVCRENQSPTKSLISFNGESNVEIWNIADWDIGVTQRGSSGSAIFDQNGRIIGQLAGGTAACNGTDDNNEPDFYGRFGVSWSFGGTNTTRLSNWLDPSNTGFFTVDMISQDEAVPPSRPVIPRSMPEQVDLFFQPSDGIVTIINPVTDNIVQYSIYSVSGALVGSGKSSSEREDIDMRSKSSGMYFVKVENSKDGSSFTKKVIVNRRF